MGVASFTQREEHEKEIVFLFRREEGLIRQKVVIIGEGDGPGISRMRESRTPTRIAGRCSVKGDMIISEERDEKTTQHAAHSYKREACIKPLWRTLFCMFKFHAILLYWIPNTDARQNRDKT